MDSGLEKIALKLLVRAGAGKASTLRPETARQIAQALLNPPEAPPRSPTPLERLHKPDLYSEGSTVYRLDERRDILEIVAWARNSLVALAAYEELVRKYPEDRYEQRRRGWVESLRPHSGGA